MWALMAMMPSVSTHSRPKAAGLVLWFAYLVWAVSTHSRPKAAGASEALPEHISEFQHTAARRRLGNANSYGHPGACFNTQPPEGGWKRIKNA